MVRDQANALNPSPEKYKSNTEQLYMSKQISTYRYKRLLQQQELEQLQEVESKENAEMQTRLREERQAYEETKFKLLELRLKIKE